VYSEIVPTVVVSSVLSVDVRPLLGDAEVVSPPRGSMTRAELLAAVGRAEGLIALLTDSVDDELLERAPRLRVVANHAVGVDNVAVEACTRRKIAVANTPDVLTEATADLTMALLLAAARRLREGEELVRSGAWTGWEPGQLLGAEVWGRTLGLVGFGRIGRAVARRARGFDMRVLYHARSASPEADALRATRVPLDELLASSDFVSLHVPLTPATRRMIGARELGLVKRGAILVNTARGACVDEQAVCDALAAGQLGAAALDVFEEEPRVSPCLLAQPRALLVPHIGSATVAARARMAELCATAVRGVLDGKRPPNIVNPEVLS
jgi:glyoxylate reductase